MYIFQVQLLRLKQLCPLQRFTLKVEQFFFISINALLCPFTFNMLLRSIIPKHFQQDDYVQPNITYAFLTTLQYVVHSIIPKHFQQDDNMST